MIIRLLAEIDHRIADVQFLLFDDELEPSERRWIEVQLDFRRKTVRRVETMLSGDEK